VLESWGDVESEMLGSDSESKSPPPDGCALAAWTNDCRRMPSGLNAAAFPALRFAFGDLSVLTVCFCFGALDGPVVREEEGARALRFLLALPGIGRFRINNLKTDLINNGFT